MLKINIANAMKKPGEVFSYSYNEIPNFDFDFVDNLQVNLSYSFQEGEVLVCADIKTNLNLQCTRCLQNVVYKIDCHVEEVCTKDVNCEDGYTYSTDILDLEKLIIDTLYLEIPSKILCKEDCLGLCSLCGQNLNIKKCDCKTLEFNNAFSILREV